MFLLDNWYAGLVPKYVWLDAFVHISSPWTEVKDGIASFRLSLPTTDPILEDIQN